MRGFRFSLLVVSAFDRRWVDPARRSRARTLPSLTTNGARNAVGFPVTHAVLFSQQILANRLYGVMAWIIPILVACSTFGTANGNIFAGGR